MHAQPLPALAGQTWLREAFRLYRKNPPLLTSAAMAYLLVVFGVGLLPLVGSFLLPLIQPMLLVLLANVCAMVAEGKAPTQAALLNTLGARRPALIQLGGFHLALGIVCALLATLLAGLLGAPEKLSEINEKNIHTILLPMLLLMVPMLLATWFSPLLTAWHAVPPLKALFFSFIAVRRNLGPFFVFFMNVLLFGVILPVLALFLLTMLFPDAKDLLSSLLNFVLLMTLAPILLSCVFISYRQVFSEQAAEQTPKQADEAE